jgi:hypothetical protein
MILADATFYAPTKLNSTYPNRQCEFKDLQSNSRRITLLLGPVSCSVNQITRSIEPSLIFTSTRQPCPLHWFTSSCNSEAIIEFSPLRER